MPAQPHPPRKERAISKTPPLALIVIGAGVCVGLFIESAEISTQEELAAQLAERVTKPLLAPIEHGAVLFYDDLYRQDLSDAWSLNSPQSYRDDPGPDPYIVPVPGSPFLPVGAQGLNVWGRRLTAPEGVQSQYDRVISRNQQARAGLYKGYEYEEGEHSITYLDFRQQPDTATVFPRDIQSGGGITLHSQLLQLKTWEGPGEPNAEILSITQGRNGIKTNFAKMREGNELLMPLTPGRWYRIGIEVKWTYQAGGWIQLYLNDQDPNVMRPVHERQPMAAGTLRTRLGHTYLCFGLYHVLTEFDNGDVWTEYANPTVVAVA
jgi:hypothetical protein